MWGVRLFETTAGCGLLFWFVCYNMTFDCYTHDINLLLDVPFACLFYPIWLNFSQIGQLNLFRFGRSPAHIILSHLHYQHIATKFHFVIGIACLLKPENHVVYLFVTRITVKTITNIFGMFNHWYPFGSRVWLNSFSIIDFNNLNVSLLRRDNIDRKHSARRDKFEHFCRYFSSFIEREAKKNRNTI